MFGIGSTELIIILVVALIVIGPQKLPDLMRTLGKGLSEFRSMSNDVKRTLDQEVSAADEERRKREVAEKDAQRKKEEEEAMEKARSEDAESEDRSSGESTEKMADSSSEESTEESDAEKQHVAAGAEIDKVEGEKA